MPGESMHFHPERQGSFCDFLADSTQPNNAEILSEEIVAGQPRPFPGPHPLHAVNQVPAQREQKTKSMFGHGRVIHTRRVENGKAANCRRGQIDFIQANTIFTNNSKAREGFVQNRSGNCVISTKERVEVAHQLEHARLGKRTPFALQFKGLLREQFLMFARRVLKRSSSKKDAEHLISQGCPIEAANGIV
jgi:hypothetical protein